MNLLCFGYGQVAKNLVSNLLEKKVNLNQSGYVDFTESKKIKPTFFSQYGNKIFGLITLLYIFLIFSFNRLKNE